MIMKYTQYSCIVIIINIITIIVIFPVEENINIIGTQRTDFKFLAF
jgi:hypothetical protein